MTGPLLPTDALPEPWHRYARLLQALATADVDADDASVAAALVSRLDGGTVAVEPLPPADEVRDGLGHRRPHYAGLFAYAAVRAGGEADALLDELERRSGAAIWPAAGMPAARDGEALRVTFDLLALAAAGQCLPVARAVFAALAGQRALLLEDGANPEPRWYAELCLMHALASFAALTGDGELREATAAVAAYHQAETQPDHASGQPWAVHAALLRPDTFPLADLLLLPSSLPRAGATGPDAITRILLADAALALRAPGFVTPDEAAKLADHARRRR